MKYMKRAKIYKAANVTFNPETVAAYSYDWWKFVSVIQDKIVFNEYRYSVTTVKHQNKVRRLMEQLGIEVDLYVSFRAGLQDIKKFSDVINLHKEQQVIYAEIVEARRIARNKKARERRERNKQIEAKSVITLF